jgi:hypothetical protein
MQRDSSEARNSAATRRPRPCLRCRAGLDPAEAFGDFTDASFAVGGLRDVADGSDAAASDLVDQVDGLFGALGGDVEHPHSSAVTGEQ